jgi:hypothetical protein
VQTKPPTEGGLSRGFSNLRLDHLQGVEGVPIIIVLLRLRFGYMGMICLEVTTRKFFSLQAPVTQLVYSKVY